MLMQCDCFLVNIFWCVDFLYACFDTVGLVIESNSRKRKLIETKIECVYFFGYWTACSYWFLWRYTCN